MYSLVSLVRSLKGIYTGRSAGGWNPDRRGFNYDPTLAMGNLYDCAHLTVPTDKKKI